MTTILPLLFLWGGLHPRASAYPAHLHQQVLEYHRCLRGELGDACVKRWYKPIFEYCQDRPLECSALLELADPGALNFKKCARLDSCTFGGSQAPEFFLRTILHPGVEKAEVRDPYQLPYERMLRLRLEMRVPSHTRLTSDNQSIVLLQFHAVNDHSPTFALRMKGDDRVVLTIRHNVVDEEPLENGTEVVAGEFKLARDRWHEIDFLVRTGAQGVLDAVVDGKTIASYRGPVGYRNKPNYFKFGPYDHTLTQKSDFEVHYRDFQRSL